MHFGLLSRLEYQHFLAPASITKATVKSGQHFAPHQSIALGLKVSINPYLEPRSPLQKLSYLFSLILLQKYYNSAQT